MDDNGLGNFDQAQASDILDFLFRNMKDREDLTNLKVNSILYSAYPFILEHKNVIHQNTETMHS